MENISPERHNKNIVTGTMPSFSHTEILNLLGFKVKNVTEINPNDAYLHSKIFELIGKTIDVNKISDNDLKQLLKSLNFLNNQDITDYSQEMITRARETIKAILKFDYNFENNE